MLPSRMIGLTEKDMQAVVHSYQYNDFYVPTIMPYRENYTLTFKALTAQYGLRVAADIVARGASIDTKTREAIKRLQGDIPKIAIKRTMDENELTEYNIALQLATGDSRATELVRRWAEDTEFCFTGVNARIEWMALQSISRGKVTVSSQNNNGIVTSVTVDYKVENKGGVAVPWTNSSQATPIKDIRNVVKSMRAKGIYLRYAFMNTDTFVTFTQTDEIIKQCASFAANALGIQHTPSLEEVNNMLRSRADLYGLQIIVINQDLTIELADKSQVSGNPFVTNSVMFSESQQLGETYWKRPIDMDMTGTAAIMAMNNAVLIKKFSLDEPIEEVTMGIANAFPCWTSAQRSYLLDISSTSWTIA